MPTRTTDPLDALLAHNLWATEVVIEHCRGLSVEQFCRPFPIGPGEHGGVHAILTHIIGAMRRWADRIAGREVRPPIERWRAGYAPPAGHRGDGAHAYTPDQLLAMLEEAHADLAAVIAAVRSRGETGLSGAVVFKFTGPQGAVEHSFTAGAAIASAAVHGHYHRAQCMNILRQLGIRGPSLDVIDWQQAEETE